MISHSGKSTSDNGLSAGFPKNLSEPACFAGRLPTNTKAPIQFVGTFPANIPASTNNPVNHSSKPSSEVKVAGEREEHINQ